MTRDGSRIKELRDDTAWFVNGLTLTLVSVIYLTPVFSTVPLI